MNREFDVSVTNLTHNEGGWLALVDIGNDDNTTITINVVVDDDTYEQLTDGLADADVLVEEAIRFLLERNLKDEESLPRDIDLTTLGAQYPDFEGVMREKMAAAQ